MAADNQVVWQTGRVMESSPVADGIQRIVLRTEKPGRAAPGSHVDVRVELDGGADIRSYSVVSSSDDGRTLTISVHRSPRSRGGSVFMHGLRPGDDIAMTQPLQNFPLRIGAPRYVLLAGGVGITAIAEMARVLRDLKADYLLVYVGRSRRVMAYLDELESLHEGHIRVHVDDEGTSLDVASLVDEIADGDRTGTEMYMCGPIRLMDAVRRRWHDQGLPQANLRYETFGNSGWFEPEEFVVSIPRLGIETTVDANLSLLEALEKAGADMMSDCRKGECGLCQVDILDVSGHVDHRDVFFSDEQKKESRRMCSCVSRVVSVGAARDTAACPVAAQAAEDRAVLTIDVP